MWIIESRLNKSKIWFSLGNFKVLCLLSCITLDVYTSEEFQIKKKSPSVFIHSTNIFYDWVLQFILRWLLQNKKYRIFFLLSYLRYSCSSCTTYYLDVLFRQFKEKLLINKMVLVQWCVILFIKYRLYFLSV